MNAREIFLIFVAFTLLFLLFCVVTLTGVNSDNCITKPTHQLSSDPKTAGTDKTFVHSSIENLDKNALQSKSNSASLTASNHLMNNRPGKPKRDARSLRNRTARSDIKDRLKPIESNGQIYLENTTGVEVSDSNDSDDEGAIEVIE
jgi:hypothetical protein